MKLVICPIICLLPSDPPPVAVSEFCIAYKKLVKNEFRLTEKEARALRAVNLEDIVSIKGFAKKHCEKGK